ncbi:acyl-CoA dehydrogenase family protein [Roseomonas chloroacetimidivorans]|uniref:acyl-CoA dehydrogenase family protein n=1 Tax=Roseomonas chloroacetimidivorans TaxID=1766656 RepID=UPI003C78C40A
MDLADGPEETAFRAELRGFIAAHRQRAPKGFNPYRGSIEVREWQALLIEHGYAARDIPREYGGYGAAHDPMRDRIVAEEFTAAGVPMGLSGQGVAMLTPTLLEFGTEAQKREWIPRTLRSEIIWCQGYSEPDAGSDLASLRTTAADDGEDFVINGQKIWTSFADVADMMFGLFRTDPDKPKRDGISYLILSMRSPGITVRPLRTMTGQANFNEVFFTDVRVPKANLVGPRGWGWHVANATLKHERGMLGDPDRMAVRLARLGELMEREGADGCRAIDDPALRDRLMELEARVAAMRAHGLRLLTLAQRGEAAGLAGMVVKLQGCELNHQMDALAIDVMGELGTLYGETPHLRDEGAWQYQHMYDLGLIIGGGTAQIQKNIIAERGLGLPREAARG